MAQVDTEVCMLANCPFVAKKPFRSEGMTFPKGTCLNAVVRKLPKRLVCISNVDIRAEKS